MQINRIFAGGYHSLITNNNNVYGFGSNQVKKNILNNSMDN